MKDSLKTKLEKLQVRYEELAKELSLPEIFNDQNRYRDLSKEYAQLEPIVLCFQKYKENEAAIENAHQLLNDEDKTLHELAEEELKTLAESQQTYQETLRALLLPKDPNDERNVFLEVRAGTGGHEAALFAGDLFRMYCRFAERKKWQVEIISEHEGEQGGYKEVIAKVLPLVLDTRANNLSLRMLGTFSSFFPSDILIF